RGAAFGARRRGSHIVTSAIEHHAVLHTVEQLEREGFTATYLSVDGEGFVDPAALERALRPDTAVVSIMYANNEVGTVEPIAELARAVKATNASTVFHTDAVQAGGLLPIDVEAMGVDSLALSGHKFYAPKGVGLLYLRRGTPLVHLISGGGQERGIRAGTENVAYVVGMATALELASAEHEERVAHVARLRDRLISEITEGIEGTQLTGHPSERIPKSA